MDIPNAVASTYTLVATDTDKTIKVRVTFTDDGGTEESLGSEATAAVAAAPTLTATPVSTATAAPVPTATAATNSRAIGGLRLVSNQPGALQVSWDPPTKSPRDYRVMWARVGENFRSYRDNEGNAYPTSPSYTITGLDQGVRYKVKVRARYDDYPGDWSAQAEAVVAAAAATATDAPTATATVTSTPTEAPTDTPTPTDTATADSPGPSALCGWRAVRRGYLRCRGMRRRQRRANTASSGRAWTRASPPIATTTAMPIRQSLPTRLAVWIKVCATR